MVHCAFLLFCTEQKKYAKRRRGLRRRRRRQAAPYFMSLINKREKRLFGGE